MLKINFKALKLFCLLFEKYILVIWKKKLFKLGSSHHEDMQTFVQINEFVIWLSFKYVVLYHNFY